MGVGTLLATLLNPSSLGEMDADSILRREVETHIRVLSGELNGFKMMSANDKDALGDLYTRRNADIDRAITDVQNFFRLFKNRHPVREVMRIDRVTLGHATSMGYCNMHDLLIQFVRDWGTDNDNVRRSHHDIVLAELKEQIKAKQLKNPANPQTNSILIPGDALCRMSWDVSMLNAFQDIESNEASPLFAEMAYFMVNCVEAPFEVMPHAGVFSNQETVAGHCRRVMVPGPMPSAPPRGPFTMTVGAFEQLYSVGSPRYRQFDFLITSFFLDTIPGPVTTALTIISNLLAPNGVWINYGPLLYRSDSYPKLSWEEITALLPSRNLTLLKSEQTLHAEYCERTETSLHPTIYNPRLLVAMKNSDTGGMFPGISPARSVDSFRGSRLEGSGVKLPKVWRGRTKLKDDDEFYTPDLMRKEVKDVERYLKARQCGGVLNKPGIPNVVHTLFHKMLCKETALYRDLREYNFVDIEKRLNAAIGGSWMSREQFPEVLQGMFPRITVNPSDCEVLFDLIDGDRNGDVGVEEVSNGLLLLLSNDRHTLLQRCRNIVSQRQQSAKLVYLSRYELVLLASALLDVYKDDVEWPLIKREIDAMIYAFEFTLRGRIQLDVFQSYMEAHDTLKVLMYESPDVHHVKHADLTAVTIFEKTASEDDQERHFASRNNVKSAPRLVDAYLVDDSEVQKTIQLPQDKRTPVEGLRWDDWDKCYLLEENSDGTVLVEWMCGGISTIPKEGLRQPKIPKRQSRSDSSLISSTLMQFIGAGQRAKERKTLTPPLSPLMSPQTPLTPHTPSKVSAYVFRRHKLNPVPPLKDRLMNAAMLSNGNVSHPSLKPLSVFKHAFASRTVARLTKMSKRKSQMPV